MTSNKSNRICSKDVMVDSDPSGKNVCDVMEKQRRKNWCASQPSQIIAKIKKEIVDELTGEGSELQSSQLIPKIKQEKCDNLQERGSGSSPSEKNEDISREGKKGARSDGLDNNILYSQSVEECDAAGWTLKVLDVQDSDLKVFANANFDNDGIATHVQIESNDVTEAQETRPDSDGRQQEVDERPSCELCSLRVETTRDYYHHLKTHCIRNSCECPVCGKDYQHNTSLFNHLRSHAHLNNKKTCKYCKRIFSKPSTLKVHERAHTGVKPYKCAYCMKGFVQRSHLKRHQDIHTGVKPYKCTYCNRAFTQQVSLKNHERIHTGVKPYKCSYCDKAFIQQGVLKNHERIHTGVKPHKCSCCNKAFTQQGALKNHERIHSGVKPYKCTYCNKTFTERGHLKKHEGIHKGVELPRTLQVYVL